MPVSKALGRTDSNDVQASLTGSSHKWKAGMMEKISGAFWLILGTAIWVLTISVLISWWAICFGSIILGVILLIFAPHILLAPLLIGVPGTGFIALGIGKLAGKSS